MWKDNLPEIELDENKLTDADCVISTVDTERHKLFLCRLIENGNPLILCGPPGSGKTMTLIATLKELTG